MTAHSAGVLAHGLHAVAHHIALHRLPVTNIDAYPARDRGPAIKVQVATADLPAWLPTVYVDQIDDQPVNERIHRHRTVRLADTGVVVDLLTVESATRPVLVSGGAA